MRRPDPVRPHGSHQLKGLTCAAVFVHDLDASVVTDGVGLDAGVFPEFLKITKAIKMFPNTFRGLQRKKQVFMLII